VGRARSWRHGLRCPQSMLRELPAVAALRLRGNARCARAKEGGCVNGRRPARVAPYAVTRSEDRRRRASRCRMSYTYWNERLVEHVLGRSSDSSPISRIPATPEELCIVAGKEPATLTSTEIDAIVARFLGDIKAELASPRRSLLRYCLYYRQDASWWSPTSYQEPYFFAMLWLTCLIAYGYPTNVEGDFYARMRTALDGNASLQGTVLGELDDVWEDLERWTCSRPDYRALVLPPRSAHRSIIGRSHFLAYPHRVDRTRLASVLEAAGLAGHEPPVRLALEALLAERQRFSDEFQDDLKMFFADYIDQGRDPKLSPFWRAIRQVARDLPALGSAEMKQVGQVGLLAEWDQDDLLAPFIALTPDRVVPSTWLTEDLDARIGAFTRRAVLDQQAIEAVLSTPARFMRAQDARAIEEGILPLFEEISGVYRVAIAEEIASCEMALVKKSLASAFREAFGGREEDCGVDNWVLFTAAQLEQRDHFDGDLSAVRTLLQTTEAPRPSMAGGSRSAGNTFHALSGYLPFVRARRATTVTVRWQEQPEVLCDRTPSDADPDRWELPAALVEQVASSADLDIEYEVVAYYDANLMGRTIRREARTTFRLRRPVLSTGYRGLPSGSFRVETCTQGGKTVVGPQANLPFTLAGGAAELALDVLPFDPTARWIGPGLGEMSLEPRARFPWLVVGPKKQPEYLVLDVEDPTEAPAPSGGTSSFAGDRRHWGRSFGKDVPAWWKQRRVYVSQDNWPHTAQDLLNRYRARVREKRPGVFSVPETHLDSHLSEGTWGVASPNAAVHDVLAALFQNRAGIPLREVHEHIARILNLADAHSLREHLVRALVESGAVDTLRRTDGRQTVVVARRPQLVAFRRGPRWKAALVGLVPSAVRNELRAAVRRCSGASVEELRGPSVHLPSMLRLTVDEPDQLLALSAELGLLSPEYLEWPSTADLPEVLRIDSALRRDPVPDVYSGVDATWCWTSGSFRRHPATFGEFSVERRRDGHRAPIYVLLRNSEVTGWSYYRTWALLAAYEASDRPFLREEGAGVFVVEGASPLHLPLPLARLCAVVGLGAPGPRVRLANPSAVEAYCYPFGPHLLRLLIPNLPSRWISRQKM
jgi:hypothetical protein